MDSTKATRLSKIARELNVGITTIVDFLHSKGQKIDSNPNSKITEEQYDLLFREFSFDLSVKKESEKVNLKHLRDQKEIVSLKERDQEEEISEKGTNELLVKGSGVGSRIFETETERNLANKVQLNILGKIDIEKKDTPHKETPKKAETSEVELEKPVETETVTESETVSQEPITKEPAEEESGVKVLGKIDLSTLNQKTRPDKKTREEKDKEREGHRISKATEPKAKESFKKEPEKVVAPASEESIPADTNLITPEVPPAAEVSVYRAKAEKLSGPTVVGRMELPTAPIKKPSENYNSNNNKKKRKRIVTDKVDVKNTPGTAKPPVQPAKDFSANRKRGVKKPEISEVDIQKQIKDTLARLTTKGKSKGSKHRRDKRELVSQRMHQEELRSEQDKHTLKVTEFVTVSELATMMDVPANEVISTCMSLGLFVSINQRLDAETMSILADEHGFAIEFVSVELQESIAEEEDKPEQLIERSPIVTVMGHVDHGKTKLLDYVRSANVVAGEAGGITQHIGAYAVKLDDGRQITFLDTPGHEAFTAMRARGAQVTDLAIIVIAADDGVKPQTVEAINHAQAASVPMVFAINKVDIPTANPEKIKEELAKMNILVEDWGGKYQSQEISAKSGLNIKELLDKVLLEAEMLELKANPNKKAIGTVVDSALDKGRGYVSTVLVQSGTLKIGDVLLAGTTHGKVKAMYNERGQAIKDAGPSQPVLVLGLDGAPQAGDKFNVLESEREAREIANKREQLQREQGIRTQKHITLDEIGRRIAIGNFQELNVIVKGDVDGSVEALSDSLLKLSTEEIQVNIKHKAVGQISEADILLAAASNAIVIGFQVRPSVSARKLAEKEQIDVRLYSIIYDAIEEIRSAMEGMLSPEIKENIVATLEILEVFKITKVGTIAGCIVREGKIKRANKVRVIRDGIVIHTGQLGSLKRFKDDVKEAVSGQECGLNIDRFNDIVVGDMVEAFEQFEVKKTL